MSRIIMNNEIHPYGFTDWSLFVIYLILIFLCLAAYRGFRERGEIYKKYFLIGFLLKVFGGVLFALVFMYYYGFGDTFLYYYGGKTLSLTFFEDPITYFRLMTSPHGGLPPDLRMFEQQILYHRTQEEWFMVKFLSPFTFISFNSYLVTTLFMSLISFIGSWKLFKVFVDVLPQKKNILFYISFLIPSVFFWGSGILKDTVTLAAINLIIYSTYFMFFKGKYETKYWIFLGIGLFVLLMLKLYILVSFLPAMALGIYYHFRNRINSQVINFALRPVLIIGLFTSAYLITLNIGQLNKKYELERLEQQARGFHTWHVTTGGSAYTLGEIEYTPIGVLRKVPAALNVTLFRPYIWEANNAMMLLGALESSILLFLFLYMLWLWGFRLFKAIGSSPLLITLLVYILIFGFAVGFTSYNFGALARYKIPITSLVFFVVYYLVYSKRQIDQSVKTVS